MRETLDKIFHDLLTDHGALGRLRVFKENPDRIRQALKRGDIDDVDQTGVVVQYPERLEQLDWSQ